MEQIHQRGRERLELETPPSLIPTQRRVLPDDEVDSDLILSAPLVEPAKAAAVQIGGQVGGLSERDQGILDFEKQWWRHAGAKEQAIRDRFELSGTRYYQILNALLDDPAALQHDPVLVGRLRRLRGSRARSRGR